MLFTAVQGANALEKKDYSKFASADKDTNQNLREATLNNFFMGRCSGLNGLAGDQIDGALHRYTNGYKDRTLTQNGEMNQVTFALIA